MNSFFTTLALFFITSQQLYSQTALHKDDASITGWASSCIVVRGTYDGVNLASAGTDTNAIGVADNVVISLGDGGHATLSFSEPILNVPGPDFAVFENSFSNIDDEQMFLELAFVEVSSDGINFFRFPSVSLTQTETQIGAWDTMDNSKIQNLAGKYPVYYGTSFDLEELQGITGLDINNITHVRIIDVVGSIDDALATYDSLGNKINDPYPTQFPSCGFDLDAVATINQVNNGTVEYVNSVKDNYLLFNMNGIQLNKTWEDLSPGIYILKTIGSNGIPVFKKVLKI